MSYLRSRSIAQQLVMIDLLVWTHHASSFNKPQAVVLFLLRYSSYSRF